MRVGVRSALSCVMRALLHQNRADILPLRFQSVCECVGVCESVGAWVRAWVRGCVFVWVWGVGGSGGEGWVWGCGWVGR